MAIVREGKIEKDRDWERINEKASENQVQTTIYLSRYGNPLIDCQI